MERRNGNVVYLDAYRAEKKRPQAQRAPRANKDTIIFGLFWPEHLPLFSVEMAREGDEPPHSHY